MDTAFGARKRICSLRYIYVCQRKSNTVRGETTHTKRAKFNVLSMEKRKVQSMNTIFINNTGPLIQYNDGVLRIDDLNPSYTMIWKVSRWELFKIGCKSVWASIKR